MTLPDLNTAPRPIWRTRLAALMLAAGYGVIAGIGLMLETLDLAAVRSGDAFVLVSLLLFGVMGLFGLLAVGAGLVTTARAGQAVLTVDDRGVTLPYLMTRTIPWCDIAGITDAVTQAGPAAFLDLRRGAISRRLLWPFGAARRVPLRVPDVVPATDRIRAHPGFCLAD